MNKRLADKGRRIGKEYVFCPGGFGLDWDKIGQMYPDPDCYLVAVDGKQIAVLLALFKFMRLQWIWGFAPRSTWDAALFKKWDEISSWVSELEGCLMSGCKVSDLASGLNRLTAAIAGEEITIEVNGVPTLFDYTETGISPLLASIATDTAGLAALANLTTLTGIQTAISGLDLAVTVQPAAPMITIEPAAPMITIEPAAPMITIEPAAPMITIEPAAPMITIEPAVPDITVDATTDISAIVTALAPLSDLGSLPEIANSFPDLINGLEGLENLQSMGESLVAIGTDLGYISTGTASLEHLSTIAEALPLISEVLTRLVDVEGKEVVTLQEILDELDNTTIGDVADFVEVISFLKALVPSFNPSINLAGLMTMLTEWRFREGITNLMMDIAISQRAQAMSQGGVDLNTLYDVAENTGGWIAAQTAKSGGPLGWFTGAAGWLWLQIRPAQFDGWTNWVDQITGLLLGSIRGASYDNAAQLEELNRRIDAIENVLGGTYEPD